MSQVCDNALAKVDEARYFLALMERIEESQVTLPPEYTAKQEYTYLLSAFVGACYGVTEYLRHGLKTSRASVKNFREKHKHIYGHGPRGGWRTLTVHFRPVVPDRKGYMPPHHGVLHAHLKPFTPLLNGGQVNFKVKDDYYFTDDPSEQPITRQCEDHLAELEKFIKENCP
jgi:hypothetical protein